jgi:hypothetical protein
LSVSQWVEVSVSLDWCLDWLPRPTIHIPAQPLRDGRHDLGQDMTTTTAMLQAERDESKRLRRPAQYRRDKTAMVG